MKIELFSELYSCYYNTVFHILKEASEKSYNDMELWDLIRQHSEKYGIPAVTNSIIGQAIRCGEDERMENSKDSWPFFEKKKCDNFTSRESSSTSDTHHDCRLNSVYYFPLTTLEKRWLKSIYTDPRVKLFCDDLPDLNDVEPLFDLEDFVQFDQYSIGDPYEDTTYRENFRTVLAAVREKKGLLLTIKKANIKWNTQCNDDHSNFPTERLEEQLIYPLHLEYSERDNVFRLTGIHPQYGRSLIKISSIVSCDTVDSSQYDEFNMTHLLDSYQKEMIVEIKDTKKALNRFMMNFSHYEKMAEYQGEENVYRITIQYDDTDENDLLIRILSFGPNVKVIGPDSFVNLIVQKLKSQKVLTG